MKSDIGWLIIIGFVCVAMFLLGTVAGADAGLRDGYIACLVDIQNNKPMKYVLKKQADCETRWVENTAAEK